MSAPHSRRRLAPSQKAGRTAKRRRSKAFLLGVVGDLQGIGQEALPELETIAALPAAEEVEI